MEGRIYGHAVFTERDYAMRERIVLRPPEEEETGEIKELTKPEVKFEQSPNAAETFSEQEEQIPRLVESQPKTVVHAIRNFALFLERTRAELGYESENRIRRELKNARNERGHRERGVLERMLLIAATKLLLPLLRLFLFPLSKPSAKNHPRHKWGRRDF